MAKHQHLVEEAASQYCQFVLPLVKSLPTHDKDRMGLHESWLVLSQGQAYHLLDNIPLQTSVDIVLYQMAQSISQDGESSQPKDLGHYNIEGNKR